MYFQKTGRQTLSADGIFLVVKNVMNSLADIVNIVNIYYQTHDV